MRKTSYFRTKHALSLLLCAFISITDSAIASSNSFLETSSFLDVEIGRKVDIKHASKEVFDYFQGEWVGSGEFANGKRIDARVSFATELGGNWMIHRHVDQEPNKFQSMAFWGVERNQAFLTMMLVDNFKSMRRFQSEGFNQNTLVFEDSLPTSATTDVTAPRRRERFTFLKLKDDLFQMTYESNTNDQGWKLGDWILFRRQKNTSE